MFEKHQTKQIVLLLAYYFNKQGRQKSRKTTMMHLGVSLTFEKEHCRRFELNIDISGAEQFSQNKKWKFPWYQGKFKNTIKTSREEINEDPPPAP